MPNVTRELIIKKVLICIDVYEDKSKVLLSPDLHYLVPRGIFSVMALDASSEYLWDLN